MRIELDCGVPCTSTRPQVLKRRRSLLEPNRAPGRDVAGTALTYDRVVQTLSTSAEAMEAATWTPTTHAPRPLGMHDRYPYRCTPRMDTLPYTCRMSFAGLVIAHESPSLASLCRNECELANRYAFFNACDRLNDVLH